jgi:drug/metabolite transporter (DMT)-like permease
LSNSTTSNQKKGLLLTFVGAMILTFDTPVLRLVEGTQWPVLFWRMTFLSIAMFTWWSAGTLLKKPMPPLVNGSTGFVVSWLYAAGNITFITAVFNTSIANVVFILALTPVLAAFVSFVWLRERIGMDTVLALICAMAGVSIIVWHGLGNGTLFGDLMAASTAATLALALTVTRRAGTDMSMSPILAGIITAVVAFFLSGELTSGIGSWFWLVVNGVLVMPLSYGLLALGPKYISASQVALFFLLETVLAPIWVWLAVGEKVSAATLIGGSVILATLMTHSLYKLRGTSRQKITASENV